MSSVTPQRSSREGGKVIEKKKKRRGRKGGDKNLDS